MGKMIPTEIKGFTPVIDVVVEEVGLMAAVVFGRVWRYCQMEDGVCSASLERIASEIGTSRKTVERYVKKLCENGYLSDMTPMRRNRPHRYRETGKVGLYGALSAQTRSDRESYQNPDRSDRESDWSDRESDLGKTESLMKIHEETTEDTHDDLPIHQANFAMLARVCKIDLDTMTPTQRGKLNQVEGFMRKHKHITPEDIEAFGIWWYKHHWKGKDEQPPRPMQIREEWGIFEAWRKKHAREREGVMRV